MKRLVIALIVALSVSLAFAQKPQNVSTEVFTRHVANQLDALLITCPGDLEPKPGCYRIFGSTELHRMVLDNFFAEYYDVNWVGPWAQDGSVVYRSLVFDGGDVFTFFLIEFKAYETTVFVQWILTQ